MPLISRREFVAAGLGAGASSALPAFAVPQEPASLTLKQVSDLLRHREASPLEFTQACLKRIDQYNPSINAFITITPQQALAAAREMEAEQRAGKWRGPLHGIPIALKDSIDTAGIRTTAGERSIQGPRSYGRRGSCHPPQKGRRDPYRKAQPARIRAWRNLRSHLLWSGTQPVGIRPRAGRIIRRFRSGDGATVVPAFEVRTDSPYAF